MIFGPAEARRSSSFKKQTNNKTEKKEQEGRKNKNWLKIRATNLNINLSTIFFLSSFKQDFERHIYTSIYITVGSGPGVTSY